MIQNGKRSMAWVARISEVQPIPEADNICHYRVGGWWVVDQKNRYTVGELAIYVSIDAWVPTEIAPFLSKGNEPREYQGVKGERLRTVKLRGALSQGLLLPVRSVDNAALAYNEIEFPCVEGLDVSDRLAIVKYEPPVPAQLAGQVIGMFPSFIPKTDQERIQNLTAELFQWQDNSAFGWEVTEKLDGSSMTVFVHNEEQGVCSRNLNLKEDSVNSFWKVTLREQLIEKIQATGRNLALQGELIGEGIQGNKYNVVGQDFRLFDIYDIDRGDYLTPFERRVFADTHGIKHVPVIMADMVIQDHVQGLLSKAEGKSVLNPKAEREGLVFKCNTLGGPTFKVISNKFLLRGGD